MSLNPTEVYKQLVKEGELWADAQHAAELLEETKRSLLSQLSTESNETSAAAKEAFSTRHPDYRKHLEAMVGARRAANKAKVRYDSMKILAELRRTEAANERAANRYAT